MILKQRTSYLALSTLLFALVFGFGFQTSKAHADENKTIPADLAIDMKTASDIASKEGGGPVSEIELEQENGKWVYEAELKLPGHVEKEILIDAQTGQVLKIETENEENEKEEKEKDDD